MGAGDVVRQEIERQRDAQMLSQPGQGASLYSAAQELAADASRLGSLAGNKLRQGSACLCQIHVTVAVSGLSAVVCSCQALCQQPMLGHLGLSQLHSYHALLLV